MAPIPGDPTPPATPGEARAERDPLDAKLLAEAQPELSQQTPICVPCQRNYRCERNGILVRLGPDSIIDADLYECRGCGHQIVRGFARQAAERHGGSYRTMFDAEDAIMGDAAITDHKGRPITQGQPDTEAQQAYLRAQRAGQALGYTGCHDDTIPAEDAPEAGADQRHRW